MNKEQVLELMNAIPHDLIEEADTQPPAKHRLPKAARAGLIAACLCLALVGTGAAAVANGWVRLSGITFIPNTNVNGTVTTYAEVKIASDGKVYIPLERFSQEAQEFPRSFTFMPQYKGFDSWDEAEGFLGVNIADNPVLDQMELLPDSVSDNYGLRVENAKCIVGFHGLIQAPHQISVDARYRFGSSDDFGVLIVNATIRTNPSDSDELQGGVSFRNFEEPIVEQYVTPSGLQAVIVTARADPHIFCQVDFQLNGAHFTLVTLARDRDQLLSAVKEILDAYQ